MISARQLNPAAVLAHVGIEQIHRRRTDKFGNKYRLGRFIKLQRPADLLNVTGVHHNQPLA